MANDDALAGRKRDLEEDYFRKQDQELIERMRQAAATEASRRELGEKTGLSDPRLLAELEALGFTPGTVSLLPIVPVVQVAWAQSGVSTAERAMVIDYARQRGIAEGSEADVRLNEWLATRPSEAVFSGATRLISAMLGANAPAVQNLSVDDLLEHCQRIASASGGILGIGSVSADEQAALARIAGALRARRDP